MVRGGRFGAGRAGRNLGGSLMAMSMPIGGGGGQQSVDFGGGGPSGADGSASTGSTINFNTPKSVKQGQNDRLMLWAGVAVVGLAALWIVRR